jgi:folate-binding protein YgfZ
MTDVTGDYLALRRDVAAVRVPCDVIRAFGPDSASFLQGQLSADVAGLRAGEWVWSLLLDPQGKLVAWVRVWGRLGEHEVLLDVGDGAGQRVLDRLNRFRLRVHTELELLRWECVAVRGPACPAPEDLDVRAELRAPVAWPGVGGVDLLGPAVEIPAGIHEAGPEAYESVRIECGWPAMGAEFPTSGEPSVIPAEAGQWFVDASVSFTKGCYTGQELVARVDSRGSNTPHRLRGLVVGSNVLPPVGAEVVVDGEVRGTLTSVGESLDLRAPVALGFVHRSVEPPAEVTLRWSAGDGDAHAEVPAQVRELPLVG